MLELIPRQIFDGPEGLRVSVSPSGAALLGYSSPQPAELPPDRAVALAFALLDEYAPQLMVAIEREVRAQRLRLVQGGGVDAA
jgi:hypothetical protein